MTEIVYRQLKLKTRKADKDKRTVPAVISTEAPVDRHGMTEILAHGADNVDLSRAERGLPFIESHDQSRVNIGKMENVRLESGRMVGELRLGKSARATELMSDIEDGIVDGVSVGYIVRKWEVDEEAREYRAVDWMPFEVSAVAVPADPNAGFFRSIGFKESDPSAEAQPESDTEDANGDAATSTRTQNEDAGTEEVPEDERQRQEIRVMTDEKDRPKIDPAEIEAAASKRERERIAGITAIGEKFDKQEMARSFIDNGKSLEEFRDEVLSSLDGYEQRTAGPQPIGMTDDEVKHFSLMRALRAQLPNASKRDRDAAAFEMECSEAAEKQYGRQAKGILMPDDVTFAPDTRYRNLPRQGRRDLTAGSATQGADVVDTLGLRPESFIDLLRNVQAVERMGATVFRGLEGDVAIPRQTGGSTAYWVAENGTVTESDQTFDQVTMSPETVGAVTEISRRLLIQSSIDIEAFVRRDLATQIGIEIDRVAINGSGSSNQPEGILQTTGIGAYSATTGTGESVTWDMIVGIWKEVAKDNAAMGSLGWMTNALVVAQLLSTKKDTGSGRFLIENINDGLLGYQLMHSENVPANLQSSGNRSALIFGNWADLLIGYWSGVDVLVDPYTNSKTGAVRVVTMVDCDIDVRHAESFAASQEIIAA